MQECLISSLDMGMAFNDAIAQYVMDRDDAKVMNYDTVPNAAYAVPTPGHFLPLIHMLGAAEGEKPLVFNNHSELAAISMAGFAFGMTE